MSNTPNSSFKELIQEAVVTARDAGAIDDNNGGEDWTMSDRVVDRVVEAIIELVETDIIGNDTKQIVTDMGIGYPLDECERSVNKRLAKQRKALHSSPTNSPKGTS